MKRVIAALLFISAFVLACSDDKNGEGEKEVFNKNITGAVQKGPFVMGTNIQIQELDNKFNPTGKVFITQTSNDLGHFSLPIEISSDYVEVIASGYYYNEITGQLSASPITLRSISKAGSEETININILTTLQASRLQALVQSGQSYAQASAASQKEVLQVFNIDAENCPALDKLSIVGNNETDGILLAASCIVQANNSEAQLTELVAKLAKDIKDKGKLSEESLIDRLEEQTKAIDMESVQENLKKRYHDLGQPDINIPSTDKWITPVLCDFKFMLLLSDGVITTRSINSSEIKSLTLLVHDSKGNRLFTKRDENPKITTGGNYEFTVEQIDESLLIDQWKVYAMANCPADYDYLGTQDPFRSLKMNTVGMDLNNFFIGSIETLPYNQTVGIYPTLILKRPVAKIRAEIEYQTENLSKATSLLLNDVLCTEASIWNTSASDSTKSNLSLTKIDTNDSSKTVFEGYVYPGQAASGFRVIFTDSICDIPYPTIEEFKPGHYYLHKMLVKNDYSISNRTSVQDF